jgi:GTP-binding protein
MNLIDEVSIQVKAGDGGNGSKHFRREKYVPMGGPDGGDGGRGASVIAQVDLSVRTLLDFRYKKIWKGENGEPGGKSRSTGKSGSDLIARVPAGTEIYHEGKLVADLISDGQRFTLAKGGRGGRGNASFKSATNRAPDFAQEGKAGEEAEYRFSLKLLADVGLLGFPNAGKSTLLSRISKAKPKIADYPFTTLEPQLGVVRSSGNFDFVVADIPGLVEGAAEGKGLGIQFLKHLERTKFLIHLIDISTSEAPEELLARMDILNEELMSFSPELSEREQLLVFNKVDAVSDRSYIISCREAAESRSLNPLFISAVSGDGVDGLLEQAAKMLLKISHEENSSD